MSSSLHYGGATSAAADADEIEACAAILAVAGEMHSQGLPLTDTVARSAHAYRITIAVSLRGRLFFSQDPENEYLKPTLLPGLKALKALRATPNQELITAMKKGMKSR